MAEGQAIAHSFPGLDLLLAFHLKQFLQQSQHYTQYHTDQYHGGEGKIETEMLPFYPDITREPADPMELIAEKISDEPNDDQQEAGDYDDLCGGR